MNRLFPIERICEAPMHILQHWQAFEVRPTGVCFFPLSGPTFAVLAGLIDYTAVAQITTRVVAFDNTRSIVRCLSGDTYSLAPDYGFTEVMHRWYRQRLMMHAAGAKDVTKEVLELLGQSSVTERVARDIRESIQK